MPTGEAAPPRQEGLETSIAFALRLAQGASFGAFARRTQQAGLRPGHFAILHLIGANPGITQTALSRASGRDKSTLTPIVAEFARKGLVTRQGCEKDRRSWKLYLTKDGAERHSMLARHAAAHDALLDGIVGAQDKLLLLDCLGRIAAALDGDAPVRSGA